MDDLNAIIVSCFFVFIKNPKFIKAMYQPKHVYSKWFWQCRIDVKYIYDNLFQNITEVIHKTNLCESYNHDVIIFGGGFTVLR